MAIYVPERFSTAARTAVERAGQVPFTPLHELEVLNAFALLLARRQISADEYRQVVRQVSEDVAAERLAVLVVEWDAVFASARALSERYTRTLFTRSLDLLHVAAAQAATCRTFVSADDRQLAVARATGFDVVDIKRRVRRGK